VPILHTIVNQGPMGFLPKLGNFDSYFGRFGKKELSKNVNFIAEN
jgi:hypothetical protein